MKAALRRWTSLLLAGLVFAVFCGAALAQTSTPSKLPTAKIGYVLTLTGFAAALGQLQANAVKLAIDDLKREAVADLQLVTEQDSGASNTTAVNAFNKAIQSNPDALIGPIVGTQVLAMRPDIDKAQIPILDVVGTRSVTQNNNKYVFRYFPHDGISKVALGRYAVEQVKVKKPAIIADSTDFGQVGADILVKSLKDHDVTVTSRQSMNTDAMNIAGQVKRMLDTQPDAIFGQVLVGTPSATAIKGIRQGGYDGNIFWASGITSPSTLNLLSPSDVEGIFFETAGIVDVSNPKIADFVNRYKSRFGVEPDVFSLLCYEEVRMLGYVVSKGASGPAGIAKALATTEYKGILGTFRSDEEGTMLHDIVIARFEVGKPVKKASYSIPFTPRKAE